MPALRPIDPLADTQRMHAFTDTLRMERPALCGPRSRPRLTLLAAAAVSLAGAVLLFS